MAEKCPSEHFTVEVKGHGSKLLCNLNRARLEKRFCDFKIQVGKNIIHAHKNVLAEGCDYFRAMLSNPMKEASEGFVKIVDVDFECLKICVEYIYLGKITVMKEILQSLLEVAHRLQLNDLCEEAAKNLEDDLSAETFFTLKSVASSLNLEWLREKCDDYALKNLSQIALQKDFVDIDSKYLKFLMTAKVCPALKCKTFLIWANYDSESRGREFEEFFLNLGLNGFPLPYMHFLGQNEPLFFNSVKCLRKVMELNLSASSCKDLDLVGFQDSKFSRFAVFDKISRAIHAYDPDRNMWTKLHNMSTEISANFTAIVVGEDIFVFAKDQCNWKLRYSDRNATWSSLPNRSITKYVKAVEVDGLIYAFDETNLESKVVEVYDGTKWSHVTDKPFAGFQSHIVAVKDSIYCIGGCCVSGTAWRYHSQCNKYETRKKCWSSLPPMPEEKIRGGVTELYQKIYIIGGYRSYGAVGTTLVFDIKTEVWSSVVSMDVPRYHLRAFTIAGKIFCIGGFDDDGCICNNVEEFDPATDKWRTVTTLGGKEIFRAASVAL